MTFTSSRISIWISATLLVFFLSSCFRASTTKVIRVDLHVHPAEKFSSPLNNPRLLSRFGTRNGSYHTGADLKGRGKYADRVKAARDGRVIKTGWIRGYGNIIEIEHSDKFSTRYAHLKKILVKLGERVSRGKVVGIVGATGRATGPHLHFEILTPENRFTDPCLLVPCPTQ